MKISEKKRVTIVYAKKDDRFVLAICPNDEYVGIGDEVVLDTKIRAVVIGAADYRTIENAQEAAEAFGCKLEDLPVVIGKYSYKAIDWEDEV